MKRILKAVEELMRNSADNTYSLITVNEYLLVTYEVPVTRLDSGDTAVNQIRKWTWSSRCRVPATVHTMSLHYSHLGSVCMLRYVHMLTTASALSPILISKGCHSMSSLCCPGHPVVTRLVLQVCKTGMFYCHCFEMLNNFTFELVFRK